MVNIQELNPHWVMVEKLCTDTRTIKQYLPNVHYIWCLLKYTCLLDFSDFITMLLSPLKICSPNLPYLNMQKTWHSLSTNSNATITTEDEGFLYPKII